MNSDLTSTWHWLHFRVKIHIFICLCWMSCLVSEVQSGSAHFIACLLQDAALPQGKAGSCLPHLAGQEGKLQIPWKCSTGQGSQPWIKDLLTALPRTFNSGYGSREKKALSTKKKAITSSLHGKHEMEANPKAVPRTPFWALQGAHSPCLPVHVSQLPEALETFPDTVLEAALFPWCRRALAELHLRGSGQSICPRVWFKALSTPRAWLAIFSLEQPGEKTGGQELQLYDLVMPRGSG